MNKRLILFGTGEISRYYTEILRQLSVEIDGYVDNDVSKWGKNFFGKKIKSPDTLRKTDDLEILIACSAVDVITEQLHQMLLMDKITTKEHVIRRGIEELKIEKVHLNSHYVEAKTDSRKTIIIDNFHGSWGGAEDWAHKVALCLIEKGYDVYLIESTEQKPAKGLEEATFQIEKKEIYSVYLELVEWLWSKRPFVAIEIWGSDVLWAVSGVKRLCPEDVKIVSSILNDDGNLHRSQYEWDAYIDLYLCISSKIKTKWTDMYGIDEKKVFHRVPFIENTEISSRKYRVDSKSPLKIVYPCRLERIQKRADLLSELIKKLEKEHVNYNLNIIGDGSYKKVIMEYVNENNLYNKVKFYGRFLKKDLISFLKSQDIYLNLSEFEGTSLAMLEAMANGCVPVVTDVSGVDDFVINDVNGFVSDIGDIKSMVDNILYLDKNREKIKEFGNKSRECVFEQCKLDEYISYIEELISW